jgi:hypothetical protein
MSNMKYGLYLYQCNCYDDLMGHLYSNLNVALREAAGRNDGVASQAARDIARDVFLSVLNEGWKACGWEGDARYGHFDCTMLPPYAFDDEDHQDGGWKPVFHVKQDSNGTSFIASTAPMLSKLLDPASF